MGPCGACIFVLVATSLTAESTTSHYDRFGQTHSALMALVVLLRLNKAVMRCGRPMWCLHLRPGRNISGEMFYDRFSETIQYSLFFSMPLRRLRGTVGLCGACICILGVTGVVGCSTTASAIRSNTCCSSQCHPDIFEVRWAYVVPASVCWM